MVKTTMKRTKIKEGSSVMEFTGVGLLPPSDLLHPSFLRTEDPMPILMTPLKTSYRIIRSRLTLTRLIMIPFLLQMQIPSWIPSSLPIIFLKLIHLPLSIGEGEDQLLVALVSMLQLN
jgi:hypothetical protein